MISPAISRPNVFSIPCMPGELLTSSTKGPLLLLSISTPATDNPIALAALTAMPLSLGLIVVLSATPPWCKFDLKSPP